jgi:hypothetical protein
MVSEIPAKKQWFLKFVTIFKLTSPLNMNNSSRVAVRIGYNIMQEKEKEWHSAASNGDET